jgi:hypothetical protein
MIARFFVIMCWLVGLGPFCFFHMTEPWSCFGLRINSRGRFCCVTLVIWTCISTVVVWLKWLSAV